MSKYDDIKAGDVFNRWTAIAKGFQNADKKKWLCRCSCGVEKEVSVYSLFDGTSKSCGCLSVEVARRKMPRDLNWYLSNTKTTENGCMEWQKAATPYGRVSGKTTHREVFFLTNGFYPQVVMHKCDNPVCINPEHLQSGTYKSNVEDMFEKGREKRSKGETHPKAKLKKSDIESIVTRLESGEMFVYIAKDYGVNPQSISDISKGKNWKHLDCVTQMIEKRALKREVV